MDAACLQFSGYHEGVLELLDDMVQSFFPHHPILDEHAFQIIPRHPSRPELPPWRLHCTPTHQLSSPDSFPWRMTCRVTPTIIAHRFCLACMLHVDLITAPCACSSGKPIP